MNKLIITGTGMVSPVGINPDIIWKAIEGGHSGIRRFDGTGPGNKTFCGPVGDFDLADYISDRRFRRAASISQYALAATALALRDAGHAGMATADTALIMGITHGALCYTQSFHRELVEGGPEAVSPIYFSDSVLNAPAGNVSICFGMKGPVHTVLGRNEAAIKSLITACRMLENGECRRAIVVAAEELNELSLSCYSRFGFSPLAEGAGSVLIEREPAGAQSRPYCLVAGAASQCNPADPGAALRDVLKLCLDRAELEARDIDLVMTCAKVPIDEILPDASVADLTDLTGNAFAASVMWNAVFSAMAIRKGSIPRTVIKAGASGRVVDNVLIFTADDQGNAGAVILSKHA
jgi:3-oxoacyl-[acyl-carrier-protein] synthase II